MFTLRFSKFLTLFCWVWQTGYILVRFGLGIGPTSSDVGWLLVSALIWAALSVILEDMDEE